ncbi:MAG TPA: lytic murein transglycosylase [Solirubrobacteraceae bacterium]|nr:lytic murein transglycosylase [Solirubrobacteraceae bacterium]
MSISHKLKFALASVGMILVVMAVAAIPTAAADTCTVTATLLDGQTVTFTVNAAPGTPPAQMLPPGTPPVQNVTANCQTSTAPTTPAVTVTTSKPSTTTTTPTTKSTPTTTTTTTTTTSPSSSVKKTKTTAQSFKKPKAGAGQDTQTTASKLTAKVKKATKKAKTGTTGASGITGPGVPNASNPTFSFALPGPSPLGVPNPFIENFQIPPFLLPIYQAAGIQYNVPWQVLAAINEIETDYGRNLSVSSADAVGWMQFLPSTWAKYGVDATGSGYADPYNPVDAIFAAARYLSAAGASHNLYNAIYAYNHAGWYVESVLLRAKLIGGMPQGLVGALTGLVEGDFPVDAVAKYADGNTAANAASVVKLAHTRVKGSNAAEPIASTQGATYTNIFAKQGSPVIAVNDGKIVKVSYSKQLGHYIELQDANGNVYTYAQLGSISQWYPVPKNVKVTAKEIAHQLSLPAPKPTGPATAGTQSTAPVPSVSKATTETKSAPMSVPVTPASTSTAPSTVQTQVPTPMVKERLFANPSNPASYAAGGDLQIQSAAPSISNFQNYFSDALHLGKGQYTLEKLKAGSTVVAGTILGRIGAGTSTLASHLHFMIRPAGKKAPYIDPKPILDGWKLLQATSVYRAAGINPFYGKNAKNPTIGQVLLMSKEQLVYRVLEDPHVQIYACGRRDIQAGLIDRRILGVIEYLSASGLDPTISGLECGHSLTGDTGVDAAGVTGASVDISAINNIPILGHQGKGSITDITIRRLLTLQGVFKPDEIVSLMSYKHQKSTLDLPDHNNRIQVVFTPLFGQNKLLSNQVGQLLQPQEWTQLINHIADISEPTVPIAPSKYAIKVNG